MQTTFFLDPTDNQIEIQFENLAHFISKPDKFADYSFRNILGQEAIIISASCNLISSGETLQKFNVFSFRNTNEFCRNEVRLFNFNWQKLMATCLAKNYQNAEEVKLRLRLSCTHTRVLSLCALKVNRLGLIPKEFNIVSVSKNYFRALDNLKSRLN